MKGNKFELETKHIIKFFFLVHFMLLCTVFELEVNRKAGS